MAAKTIRTRVLLFGMLILSGARCALAQHPLVVSDDSRLIHAVFSSNDLLSEAALLKKYEQEYKAHASFRFVVITVLPTGSVGFLVSGKPGYLSHFSQARSSIQEAIRRTRQWKEHRMMRLIASGGGIVILSRVGDDVTRKVVAPPDPGIVVAGRNRFEILEVYFYRRPPPVEDMLTVEVYSRASRLPSKRESMSFSEKLKEMFGVASVIAEIRTDSWFIESRRFPIFYPFEKNLRVPSLTEYLNAGSVTSDCTRPGFECVVSSMGGVGARQLEK